MNWFWYLDFARKGFDWYDWFFEFSIFPILNQAISFVKIETNE